MKGWLRQHGFALMAALVQMRKAPGGFFFNIVVLAIALTLPFAGLTLLDNIRPVSQQLSVDPEISIFLKAGTPRRQQLVTELRIILNDKKSKIAFVPREQALATLKNKNGLGDVLTTLGDNPLPDSFIVQLDGFANPADADNIDHIAEQLRAMPEVESVQVDSTWVKRLAALLGVLRLVLLLLAVSLGMVVIAVVFNTIRLQVLTQSEEINVSTLIGATDAFIHRPFYYSGALLGLCAGSCALGIVSLSLQPLNTAIADFARLYATEFQLIALTPAAMAALLLMSAALGLIGAVLSVRHHLARLN